MPNDLRPIFSVNLLAFGIATALSSHAANYVNWEGLKPKFTVTSIAGELLDKLLKKFTSARWVRFQIAESGALTD